MELSILIVNWNTREYLEGCLQSIYGAVKGVSFEVIVLDNSSSDGSAEMVRKCFPEVRLIDNPHNEGFAKGNNLAFACSDGRVIGLLNPDTVVYPDTFENMVRYLDLHGEVGAVTCRFLNQDGTLQREYYRRFPTLQTILFRYTVLGQRLNERLFRGQALDHYFYRDKTFESVEKVEQPGASCLVMRRSLIERVGLFDEELPIFFNDVDLCRRIWDEGYEIHVVPNAHITHYGGGSVRQLSQDDLARIRLDGMYRYLKKHHGAVWAGVGYGLIKVDRWLAG